MNKFLKFFACLIVFLLPARMQLVNEIVVIIYHEMGTVVVLASDIRPALDGHMQTLREIILNKLMQLDALYHKIIVTQQEAEKYIENIQKQNRLSRKAVEELFTQAGYTYAQALEYLRGRQMIEQVVEFRVKSDKRMMVSRAQAEERYHENPPMIEAIYTLAIAFISQEQLGKNTLSDYLKIITIDSDLQFDEPFDLKESEIADDRKIILTHKEGEIVFTEAVDGGFEITRLIKKIPAKVKPFDDCYMEIVTKMRQERLKEVFESYYKLLLSQATLRFTHPEDAKVLESTEMI
ncbi:MAG: hypothetical protein K2X90_04600 [Candidatus Babeliaceae bacterium]|nr:hypothetical protein [Candidatus Babeliaceae bacterium]